MRAARCMINPFRPIGCPMRTAPVRQVPRPGAESPTLAEWTMRRTTVILLLALAPSAMYAQDREGLRRQGLPRDVQREATTLYNRASKQVVGRLEVAEDEVLHGDVAVRNGPVIIAGRVRGSLLSINGDV